MKALPIETIFTNISKFQPRIELKPGQIFSGKVLALYQNDMAQIQLAGRRLNAQLMTGLTLGEKYWFQVKPNTKGSVPLLSVIEGTKGDQAPSLQSMGINKMSGNLRLLVEALSRDQLPMTKETIGKAEKWLSQVSSSERAIQAIKAMVVKDLPKSDNTFKALYHVQSSTPLSAEMDGLTQLLRQHTHQPASVTTDVLNAFRSLYDHTKPTALDSMKQLMHVYENAGNGTNVQKQIQDLYRALRLPVPTVSIKPSGHTGNRTDEGMLQLLKLEMTPANAERVLQQKINDLNEPQVKLLQQLTQGIQQKPRFNLSEMIRSLGMTLESDLLTAQLGEMQKHPQVKAALAELLNHDIHPAVRDKAEVLIHRLTGQQLLHTNENQSLMTLFYQLPIHFKEWKSDLMMKWDLKRETSGEIDEDYSRILFYLDLQYLKETIVDMNVQNRIVTIKIVNDHQFVDQLITSFKELLNVRLEEYGYQLSSVKVEPSAGQKINPFTANMVNTSVQGVDFTV